jgi:lysophospholipase L1-like esterase
MKRKIIAIYLIVIHCALLVVLIKPNYVNVAYSKLGIARELTGFDYYKEVLWNLYANRSKTLDANSNQFVFLGNSITDGLCVESIFNAVNFGISGAKLEEAKDKVKLLNNLSNKRIFLAYGINDIPRNTKDIFNDYKEVINSIPKSATIFISSVLPINETNYKDYWGVKTNKQIFELNEILTGFADTTENVQFINTAKYLYDTTGQLSEDLQKGDGLHLNHNGNLMWVKGIKEAFVSAERQVN